MAKKVPAQVAPRPFPWQAVIVAFGAGAFVAGFWTFAAMHRVHQKAAATIDAVSQLAKGHPSKADPTFPVTGEFPDLTGSSDLARLNLLCCPGTGEETETHLATLAKWAERVRWETTRNFHRYRENPGEFGSEAAWRMAMMRTIVGKDLGVKYDETLATAGQDLPNAAFFADPRKVFLQGILGPQRRGTCASLPVLYVALGRRLGYPLHLVSAKEHLFVRWDDGKGTRVNMEPSNAGGFTSHSDDVYRKWPQAIARGGKTRSVAEPHNA